METLNLSNITRQHILRAIREIEHFQPDLNASTVYDVVYKGKRYPPLELMRLAHRLANGTAEWAVAAGTTTNAYLEKLGFSVVQKRPLILNPPEDEGLLVLAEPKSAFRPAPEEATKVIPAIPQPLVLYQKPKKKQPEKYTRKKALAELFLSEEQLHKAQTALQHKKNIILQGPPGTGKTFLARRLAYLELGREDTDKIQTVQFHAAYAYEDFIQGYRPDTSGKFTLANGVFYDFCEKAKANPDQPYFFIIEEINRGNLSSIFGELLLLLEADKRGENFAVALPQGGQQFYVPENLFVIATMNTADRSLAPLDFALRRRFAFIKMAPVFDLPFRRFLEYRNTPDNLIDRIVSRLEQLNSVLAEDLQLGEGFRIGHSYFCYPPKEGGNEAWFEAIIENELVPLLEEYWFDAPAKATAAIRQLRGN